MLPPLANDPRLAEAIDLFNEGAYEEASDLAEELFFEAAGDERPLARVLLQVCVGMVHVEQRQTAPAIERLRVGIDEARGVRDWMGIDGAPLVAEMQQIVRALERGERVAGMTIVRRGD